MKALKQHYQAIIVACCFLIMFVNQGLPSTSFNVWQPYLQKLPSVGDAGVTAGIALSTTGLSVWSIEVSESGGKLKAARNFMIAYSFGGFAFNMLPGFMKGLTGTYESAFIVFTICSVACAALVLYVLKTRRP